MDAKTTTPRQTLLEVEKELGALFFEREEEIRGLICALLCGEHVLLLGPPGAAKSELAQDLCSRISGAPYFRVQLTRSSTPSSDSSSRRRFYSSSRIRRSLYGGA